ncbi:MAG: RNA 2',3'-cyclic phosphodiesterase [Candidatus Acidiferrales bacterium]
MRLFVALEIPEEIRRALALFIERLRNVARGSRWVRAEGLHVTLKFIGEMSPEKVPELETALARVGLSPPVDVRLRGGGFFPNERHPHIFWIGVEASPNLAELAAAIDAQTRKSGVEAERRAYSPHVTLARFKNEDGLPQLHEAVRVLEPLEFGEFHASEFHLIRSEPQAGGSRYTRLASFPFAGSNS